MAVRVMYSKKYRERFHMEDDYLPDGADYKELPDGTLEVFDQDGSFIESYSDGDWSTVNIEN